jgi:uncharacterized membrane protein
MTDLLVIAIVGAATFYLGHRALITRWLWSRYPAWLDRFMGCAACLGTWVGLACGGGFVADGRDLLGIAGWPVVLFSGAVGLVLTPVASAILLYALAMTSSAEQAGGDQG